MTPGLLVVVNGAAGSAEDEPVEAALAVLRSGADVEVAATSSSDELDDVVRGLTDGVRSSSAATARCTPSPPRWTGPACSVPRRSA